MDELIVFAKAPRPGFVKTRIAAEAGPAAACDIYRQLLTITGRSLAPISNGRVLFSPANAEGELQRFFPENWNYAPQAEGDLGARLLIAFKDSFNRGATCPVIVGTDSPEVEVSDIEAAWSALRTNDLVFGPAEDGGYWLVGARCLVPEIFNGIDWGTNTVLRTSLECCTKLNLRTALLRTLHDVDTAADWQRFRNTRHQSLTQ